MANTMAGGVRDTRNIVKEGGNGQPSLAGFKDEDIIARDVFRKRSVAIAGA
jgi:hypothetical protein